MSKQKRRKPRISDVERLLCAGRSEGAIERLLPRQSGAWTMQLPGLDLHAAWPDGAGRARICIATEQVMGPVRNGGIGNTYGALAIMLAEAGFDTTVLYLRGTRVETETIEYWIDHYAQRGVRLVPCPDYADEIGFASNADRWLRIPYNMMRWLIDHPMDVVHVSEWRGTSYLCLLAKRQGLAFAQTLFLVKTSSPWMWNRLYGSHTLERADDLVKIHAERRSVEMADVVIGGSLHLLRWMASQGYALPQGRCFVQPNVATFAKLEPLMHSRALPRGARTPVDEIVFFGRLEARKGLFIFCQAIRRLIRKGAPLPKRITFMGKPGGRMPSHPDHETPDFIREVSQGWPIEVQILTGFQQYEAVEYLLGGARLAVMPSIIENSSMAVYEAAICGIPCVATNVGGNAELIDTQDHAAVLCDPHPVALGDKLEEALRLGGMVPRPSFDNAANLETWRRFHRQLGGPLHRALLEQSVAAPGQAEPAPATIGIYFTGDAAALDGTLASLAAQGTALDEVLVAIDAEHAGAGEAAQAALHAHGLPGRVVDAFDLDAGAAFNRLAHEATAAHILFLWEGATLHPGALATLLGCAARTGAAVLHYMHRGVAPERLGKAGLAEAGKLRAVVISGPSDSFLRNDLAEMPLLVDRAAFRRLGGFTTDYRMLGHEGEFIARAQLAGLECQTVMADLGTVVARSPTWMRQRGYDLAASSFRLIRPMLAATPLALRDMLLLSRGMHLRAVAGEAKGRGGDGGGPENLLIRMMAGIARRSAKRPPDGEGRVSENRAAMALDMAGATPARG
ncbi:MULTISPECIES: glycosyltransferase [unclassified Sphingomonas]|uniref:glycosyltransferase n=1 Tax=Novosphingobium rhizosphaerae TaxID=1551649 RepID=UPI0015C81341